MATNEITRIQPQGDDLFARVVSILEQARANVGRSINNNMVIAYWLIGREIVQEIQGGDERAEYGKRVIEQLSAKLALKYGRGFSTTNLRYFRTFYTVYSNRTAEIRHIACGESKASEKRHTQSGVLATMSLAVEQAGAKREAKGDRHLLQYQCRHQAVPGGSSRRQVGNSFPRERS